MFLDIRGSGEENPVEGIIFANNVASFCSRIDLEDPHFVTFRDVEGINEPTLRLKDIPLLIKALKKTMEITHYRE
jgi:hypothetical protein